MLIAQAATTSGLSQDTIRFYEKSGMLAPIRRDARGWRMFNRDDVDWLITLERLRATGMPLTDIKRFASSAHGPNSDSDTQQSLRLAILKTHEKTLSKQQAQLDACRTFLNHKINIYTKRGLK